MTTLSVTNPIAAGVRRDGNKLGQDLSDIEAWANGNIDNGNLSPSAAIAYSKLATVDAARVYNSATISIPGTGTATVLTFNSERFDTNGLHSTSSNTGRLTAKTAGVHLVGACVMFAASDTANYRHLELRLNGTTRIAATNIVGTHLTSGISPRLQVSTIWSLAATDYVEVLVAQDTGSALNVLVDGSDSPEFWMSYVGHT